MFDIENVNNTNYFSLIKTMQEKDKIILEKSKEDEDSLLFSSFENKFEPIDYILLEPRTAFATPVKYFQNLYLNTEKWPFIWRHNSTRAIGFKNSDIFLISKHMYADETGFSHYLFLKLNKNEIKVEKDLNLSLSFDGDKEVFDLKTGEKINMHIQFNFIQKPFHKTQKQRAQHTAMYKNAYRGGNITQAASKFEDYIVTVPHFSPHPYLLNEYEKLGFEKRSDMQKAVFDYLKKNI